MHIFKRQKVTLFANNGIRRKNKDRLQEQNLDSSHFLFLVKRIKIFHFKSTTTRCSISFDRMFAFETISKSFECLMLELDDRHLGLQHSYAIFPGGKNAKNKTIQKNRIIVNYVSPTFVHFLDFQLLYKRLLTYAKNM